MMSASETSSEQGGEEESRFTELEKDKTFVRKRKLSLLVFVLRMFVLGVEYAVVLPSIWLYLKRFDVKPWFFGIVFAVNPAAGVVMLPLCGRLFDKTRRSKLLILVMNCFEIFGNVIYSLGFSRWCVFFGRMCAGFGDGFLVIATSEIVFTYPASQRTGIYSLLELGRFLGITFGPVINFILAKVDWEIFGWKIDKSTSPGLLMVVLWSLLQAVVTYVVTDLSRQLEQRTTKFTDLPKREIPGSPFMDGKQEQSTSLCDSGIEVALEKDQSSPLPARGDTQGLSPRYHPDISPRHTISTYDEDSREVFVALRPQADDSIVESAEYLGDSDMSEINDYHNPNGAEKAITVYQKHVKTLRRIRGDMLVIAKQLCTREILVLFYSDLVLWLAITEFELFLPLITQEEYGWKETETSIVYICGGVWLMFVFFFIYKFGSKIKDQHYITLSLLLTITASILLMCEQIPQEWEIGTRLGIFIVICVIVFTAIPLNLVAIKSLITKLTHEDTQGVTQGVYSSISRIATITGPILAGVAFHNRVMFAFAMVLLNLVALVGVVISLTRIKNKVASMLQGR